LAHKALFFAGEAYDLAANYPEALARYQTLLRQFAAEPLARTALMRCIRLLSHLERWHEVGRYADIALDSYADLRPFEAIVVHGGKALALVDEGDDERAAYHIGKGITVAEASSLDAAGRIPRDLAQLYYALGEVRRLRAERITFSPTPPDFGVVLEQRCRLLLDAQTSYSDTMRAYDAHWSAMAGYRVGELYHKLHQDLMSVAPPQTADSPERAQLFEGAMRLRYAILLTKASSMMEHTVAMAQRADQESTWTARAEASLKQLALAREREEQAIDALPYSRAQLQAALDDLESKYQK
jgi:tetratricopeptide (TPR) repeat protein